MLVGLDSRMASPTTRYSPKIISRAPMIVVKRRPPTAPSQAISPPATTKATPVPAGSRESAR